MSKPDNFRDWLKEGAARVFKKRNGTQNIWEVPLVCSMGGTPYNDAHIEYWKTQAKISYDQALHLRGVLSTVACPAGGWNGMPKELEGWCTVADCVKHKTCGCVFGAALSPHYSGGAV